MRTVTLAEAKASLARLAREVETGAKITVTRRGKPVFDLVPHSPKRGLDLEGGRRWLAARGYDRGDWWTAEDFDAPLPEDFLITPEGP